MRVRYWRRILTNKQWVHIIVEMLNKPADKNVNITNKYYIIMRQYNYNDTHTRRFGFPVSPSTHEL